jgi:hypothetical protein
LRTVLDLQPRISHHRDITSDVDNGTENTALHRRRRQQLPASRTWQPRRCSW